MRIEIYRDSLRQWRWRARASNGNIMADGSEGYASRRNVLRALSRLSVLLTPGVWKSIKEV